MYWVHVLDLLKRHKAGVYLSVVLGLILVLLGVQQGAFPKVIVFLSTMVLCFLVSEFFIYTKGVKTSEINIKLPKVELSVLLFIQIISFVILISRFLIVEDWSAIGALIKVGVMLGRYLFLYPVVLLLYFWGRQGYSFSELGFKFSHWYVSLPLILIIGTVSYLLFPADMQFGGTIGVDFFFEFLMMGVLTAAIPEELSRHLLQTRLSRVINHQSLSWFIVSIIWAASHIPLFSAGDNTLISGSIGALSILPIGLLWGYLNQRYQSIIPSVLIHSTNLWGLHNIF